MQKRTERLGELELEVLRYITDQGPASVGEVALGFGTPRKLARTTIQTVMERLRHKGFLVREACEDVFRYAAPKAKEDVLRGLVRQFVRKTLNGSVTPFMAYLAEEEALTTEELTELQALVTKLQVQRGEKTQ